MTLPEYKHFNTVVCEALDYGLPILYRKNFYGEEPVENPTEVSHTAAPEQPADGEYWWQSMLLLREINMNLLLVKEMCSGLFREECLKAEGTPYSEFGKLLESGKLNDIPDYLRKEELEGLKRLAALSKKGGKT